jgi:hypothetical protein
MSNENKNLRPPVPYIADGSQDAAVIVAINGEYSRRQRACRSAFLA